MKKNRPIEGKPVYLYQCVVCKKKFYTHSTTAKHCGKLTQWIEGIEGKGINLKSEKVKVQVSGFIMLDREKLNEILQGIDSHRGLVCVMPMGYCDTDNLEFSL